MDKAKFRQERQQALEDLRAALDQFVRDQSHALYNTYDERTAILPDHVRVQEIFRAAALSMQTVAELMKNIDAAPISADGRLSALDDVLKALDNAELNFERDYKPLNRDQIAYWQKKHPLDPEHLELAWKANQQHFMKEAHAEMRALISGVVRLQPPGFSKKPPKSPGM